MASAAGVDGSTRRSQPPLLALLHLLSRSLPSLVFHFTDRIHHPFSPLTLLSYSSQPSTNTSDRPLLLLFASYLLLLFPPFASQTLFTSDTLSYDQARCPASALTLANQQQNNSLAGSSSGHTLDTAPQIRILSFRLTPVLTSLGDRLPQMTGWLCGASASPVVSLV